VQPSQLHAIDVLLTENELADGFLAALRQRYLAEKFFYWFPLSVKAWLELCQGEQPYKNFSRSYQLVARHAGGLAGRWQGGRLEVVSLGAGQGDKDILLLQALAARGVSLTYRPVDSSQALLEMAVRRAADAGLAVRGLKADVAEPRTAQALAASATEPRLYLILGNSLGVIDPEEFLGALRHLLRPEDHVLVDGEIFDARDTLVGYDNPVNRRFAFAPLASLGLEDGRDGALVFSTESDSNREGLYRVNKHFRAARRLEIPVAGYSLTVQAEEKISMNCSYKYSRSSFLRLVQETGGVEVFEQYLSDDERFLLVLAAPAAQ